MICLMRGYINSETMKVNWIIDKLFSEIPLFKRELEINENLGFISQLLKAAELYDNPYVIFQDFAVFMKDKIKEQRSILSDDGILKDCFTYIGKMIMSTEVNSDPELFDIIYVGVLELLTDEPQINEIAEKYLEGEALYRFKEYIRKINNMEPFY